ncbi:MAG: translation elongation factor 4, partial [Patescibacteria group bacterium]
AIIAHVDHGKSTLADRLLELTGLINPNAHEEQMLDRNPISRERGITIKLAPVRMNYSTGGVDYILNLIDTPGHVDFSYEVDRTLACVEGVLLLVDATQGIQAQTIANAYKAIEKNLIIIPVVNKIDMPSAEVAKVKKQLVDFLGVSEEEIFEISAKTGLNVPPLLDAVVNKIPAPAGRTHESLTGNELECLIFDSYYDTHQGVIAFVRVFEGSLKKGLKVRLSANGSTFEMVEAGIFDPELKPKSELTEGEIGYVVTNLKDIHQVRVGDTIVDEKSINPPLSGYRRVKPMVYASMFPTDSDDYLNLKKALEKLYLNDSSLEFNAIYSQALGAGFRVGFLGLLHADVVRERLEREFNLSLVLTPPQVEYRYENGVYEEPYVTIMILTPQEHSGAVMQLCEKYRARFVTMDNLNQISVTYEMPLVEMISDFFDRLKSVTSGYASLDWEFLRYEKVKADKLSVMINLDEIEEFSEIVVQERSMEKASELVKKLKELIPRQQFEIKIQAKYKGKIIASERVSPFRKDVLIHNSKVVGAGDVGRKNKLLEKQKEGKKRMKMVGKVEIPKDAFMKLFKRE